MEKREETERREGKRHGCDHQGSTSRGKMSPQRIMIRKKRDEESSADGARCEESSAEEEATEEQQRGKEVTNSAPRESGVRGECVCVIHTERTERERAER